MGVRKVARRKTVPWCICTKGKDHGFTKRPDGLWVHPCCLRPSRTYWEKRLAPGHP